MQFNSHFVIFFFFFQKEQKCEENSTICQFDNSMMFYRLSKLYNSDTSWRAYMITNTCRSFHYIVGESTLEKAGIFQLIFVRSPAKGAGKAGLLQLPLYNLFVLTRQMAIFSSI